MWVLRPPVRYRFAPVHIYTQGSVSALGPNGPQLELIKGSTVTSILKTVTDNLIPNSTNTNH